MVGRSEEGVDAAVIIRDNELRSISRVFLHADSAPQFRLGSLISNELNQIPTDICSFVLCINLCTDIDLCADRAFTS